MRIACVGGGPGGLYFATLMKRADPSTEISVFERNRAEDTWGFGVVFSDATLRGIENENPELLNAINRDGRRWDSIEVRLKGERFQAAGNGMTAITRSHLLALMQEQAIDAGVDVRFTTEVVRLQDLDEFDLIVASDGANSTIRTEIADKVGPSVDESVVKFIWLGTTYMFDGLTFVHKRGEHGVFAVHGYPISNEVSTFIVETDEASWRAAGLDEFDVTQPPGASDEKSRQYLKELFADEIDGADLLVNNSRWSNFRMRYLERWHHGNVVFIGDAAHTAHFSVGSGTKMAMEDGASLAKALLEHPDNLELALTEFENLARPSVQHIQGISRPSLAWWENFGRYYDSLDPQQFAFHFMTRSIGRAKTAQRDPEFVRLADQAWLETYGTDPLRTPIEIAGVKLAGRVVRVAQTISQVHITDDAGNSIEVHAAAPPGSDPAGWVVGVQAPDDEADIAAAVAYAVGAAEAGAVGAVIDGGNATTRTMLSEVIRMDLRLASIVVETQADPDRCETLVLSGRADVVAVSTLPEPPA